MLKIIGDAYNCNGRKIVLKNSIRTYTTYKYDMSVEGDALKIRLIDKYRDYRIIKIDEIDHIECVNLAI